MLPFLKLKDEASASMPVETIERDHDEGFDMLDAVAEDLLSAMEKKDKGLLKAALQSFAEHLQDMDQKQDEGMIK